MKNIKVKPLTKEQLIISLDRLTRFKNTEVKYLRVFTDILLNNLLFPKFKRTEIEKLDYSKIKDFAEYIINFSLEILEFKIDDDYLINQRLYDYEKAVFNFDENVEKLLQNKIHYKAFLPLVNEYSPKNLRWLKALSEVKDIKEERFKKSLRFPIEKVVIAEGATEETLLPEFAKRCGYDFDREGIYVLSAGGKNQVVKAYYQMADNLRLPVFVLLDKDAKTNLDEIKPKLRKGDKIHLLECGEFEDLLPKELVLRTLENDLKNISILEKEMLNDTEPRVKFLEEVFKNRGMHEFKKVEFAKKIKENIHSDSDISPEVVKIISEIRLHGDEVKK